MKSANLTSILLSLAVIFLLVVAAWSQTTAFSYQGNLSYPAVTPAKGNFDFQFTLTYAPNGWNIIAVVPRLNFQATNGVFNTSLDFGAGAFVLTTIACP